MSTLGAQMMKDSKIEIPFSNLIFSLVAMTVPMGIGVLFQKYKPSWAAFCRRILKKCTVVLIILITGTGLYSSRYIFKLFTWQVFAAGIFVGWGGYVFGALFAMIARLKLPQIIAVSIETAFQNPGVAFVLLRISVPQPQSDLSAVPVIGQLLVMGPPIWLVFLVFVLIKRIRARDKDKQTDPDESPEVKIELFSPIEET